MSRVAIDHAEALATLERAVAASRLEGFEPSSKFKDAIKGIVCGGHLTYRYILATALLAKAVERSANPLVLQAGAEKPGAYDARSLCHKVIVPHEARLLDNGLGGSNEPYLNKPARFKTLSLDNAVRAGSDRRTLIALHFALSRLQSSQEAFSALCDLAYIARKQKASLTAEMKQITGKAEGGRTAVIAFLRTLISVSGHGETSALVAAVLFWIMGISRNQKWTIKIHPVNESGASSNQISDIDVYSDGTLIITAEVKDKTFKLHDVEHAVEKVKAAGHHTLHFIRGPRGTITDSSDQELIDMSEDKRVDLLISDLGYLINDVVSFAPASLALEEVAEQVRRYAEQARVSAQTWHHITSALS